mgnify:FL=1
MSIKDRLFAAGATGLLAITGAGIYQLEGEVRTPYMDVGGVGTVCMGSTVYENRTYSAEECIELLIRDTKTHLDAVMRVAPATTPDSVLAAMASVSYNVGVAGFLKSPMVPHLVAEDWEAACNAIVAPWRTSKGVAKGYRATVNLRPHKGLENRRAKEHKQCLSGLPQ